MFKIHWMAWVETLQKQASNRIIQQNYGIIPPELITSSITNILLWLLATLSVLDYIEYYWWIEPALDEALIKDPNPSLPQIINLGKRHNDPRAKWILRYRFAPEALHHLEGTVKSLKIAEASGINIIHPQYYHVLGRSISFKPNQISMESLKGWEEKEFDQFIRYAKEEDMANELIDVMIDLMIFCSVHKQFYASVFSQCPSCQAGLPAEIDLENARYEEGEGNSFEDAKKAALDKIPQGERENVTLDIVKYGKEGVDTILAMSRDEAIGFWKEKSPDLLYKSINCIVQPKVGFMGLGKKVGEWRIHWTNSYKVRIFYR
jgi:hypothetical protein